MNPDDHVTRREVGEVEQHVRRDNLQRDVTDQSQSENPKTLGAPGKWDVCAKSCTEPNHHQKCRRTVRRERRILPRVFLQSEFTLNDKKRVQDEKAKPRKPTKRERHEQYDLIELRDFQANGFHDITFARPVQFVANAIPPNSLTRSR